MNFFSTLRPDKKTPPVKEIFIDDKYRTVNYSIETTKQHLKKRRSLRLDPVQFSPEKNLRISP